MTERRRAVDRPRRSLNAEANAAATCAAYGCTPHGGTCVVCYLPTEMPAPAGDGHPHGVLTAAEAQPLVQKRID